METVVDIIKRISPYYAKEETPKGHSLVYDSSSEAMEPIYFFILDLMNDLGLAPEKLVDNFSSTPGGQHFTETGMKAARMQEEAMKILGGINMVLKTVLNIVYDLKDFKIRLQTYVDLKDDKKKEAAILALKQVWMDKVDIQKGNSSIKAMGLGQAGFQTLIDAFLSAKDAKAIDKLDLNDRIKRILKPRILEFNTWLEQSEKELKKRYEMEKNYLKNQVSTLNLYSRWAKPYLMAAQQLERTEAGREASLVSVFNTLRLQLTLLGKSKLKVKEAALEGKLPKEFQDEKFLRSLKREYYNCVLVDFKFRAIPRQGSFVGRTEVSFRPYSLNDVELAKLDEEMNKSDLADVLSLIEGATSDSIGQLQEDIDMFLDETKEEVKEKSQDVNPFSALVGAYNKPSGKSKSKEKAGGEIIVKKDNFIEKEHFRKLAQENAEFFALTIFDVYKKAHGMASYT